MEKLYIIQDLQEVKDTYMLFTQEEYKNWLINGAVCEYEVNKGYYDENDDSTLCHLDNMVFFKNVALEVKNNNLESEKVKEYLSDFQYKVKEIDF